MKLNDTEHTVHSLDKSRRVAHTGFSWVKKGQTLDLSTIPPTLVISTVIPAILGQDTWGSGQLSLRWKLS